MAAKKPKHWKRAPSPCIDICKYPGSSYCKGCGMLKAEKKRFKQLSEKGEIRPFFQTLVTRLEAQGGKRLQRWVTAYGRKCDRKGLANPLEKLALPEPKASPGKAVT
jgi:predicted Fe-S protein YdhL (DUF1289 family)